MTPRTFALFLAQTPGIGGRTIARILARNLLLHRSPDLFLGLSSEAWIEEYRLSSTMADNLRRQVLGGMRKLEAYERRLTGLGVELVVSTDAHYPARIEQFDPEPPGILFLYGNQRLLQGRTFCVLASRMSTPAQLEQIETSAERGVLAGDVLVSSHDRIEYQRSAIVPLRWGAPRILALDRGLFQVLGDDLKNEAFRAARLWRYEFDPTTDLVLSPFRPEAGFVGVNNQVRDRLVASLSDRLHFIHVSPGGGMDRLRRLAIKAGREVTEDATPEPAGGSAS
ncbi:MAG: hypothetical protein SFX74_06150 [Fimbriimonadaceae bacterium]|nr:hypothetical protein [Fimbriimonadaceae bacterium]